jgi:Helix-turn-helix domain
MMDFKPNYYAVIPANVRYDKDLSPNAKLLYGEITALANASGFCWATNAYFAELYDVTKRSVQMWLSQLEKAGYIRVVLVNEGQQNDSARKIYLNFTGEKNFTPPRKKIHGEGEENFTPPHEENFTHNNTSINTTNNNTKNIKKNRSNWLKESELQTEFDELWRLYPRKVARDKAYLSYKKARRDKKIPYETIKNGLYRYLDYLKTEETDKKFIPHGSTWFNQARWETEYIATKKKASSFLDYYKDQFGGENNGFRDNSEIIEHDAAYLP